jgi:hypothetical protein
VRVIWKILSAVRGLTIAIEREWVYLLEPIRHLHVKDADVIMKNVELLDVSHLDASHLDASHLDVSHLDVSHLADVLKVLDLDQEVPRIKGATVLAEDMLLHQDMSLDAEADHLDVEVHL